MAILPQKPRSGFHSISELTRCICGIIDYLASFKFDGGDGIEISRNINHIQIKGSGQVLSGTVDEQETTGDYDGPYAVHITDGGGLQINGGFAICNGIFMRVSGTSLGVQNGFLCVVTEHSSDTGLWATPKIQYANPGAFAYPIAEIKKSGERIVHGCSGGVALFFATELCPVELIEKK